MRTCVACGSRRPKAELLRLTLDLKNRIIGDPRQRSQGRGAYVCFSCVDSLRFSRRVRKAFRNKAEGLSQHPFAGDRQGVPPS